MKKFIYTLAFAAITSWALSACSEENVKPIVDGSQADRCQFGGPNCPK
jgi:hypothetical protein